MPFQPDYRHMLAVLRNQRPARLPMYEHKIDVSIMERILGEPFADLEKGDDADLERILHPLLPFLPRDDLRHRVV